MSIGLALIFGVMRVVNFAQGDFMMLGMYLTYFYAVAGHVDPLLGAVLTIPPFFVLGWLVHPAFFGLSAFVGAGLVFAGITDWCGMGMLLAKMPWNNRTGDCRDGSGGACSR